jgi:hypothetical protein
MEMLTYKRPGGSKAEKAFIRRFLMPLGLAKDAYGNLYKRIGAAPVLWSSHTDTVHKQGGRQAVRFVDGFASAPDKNSNCLGADCTAGVFLMREMILAGVEGLYIFHRDEEVGGRGSEFIASKNSSLLAGIKYAIAFDRRGTNSVITHQWGGRCCSEDFAVSLGHALKMAHEPDDGGSFTDTANYTHLIGECTNLSVGYYNEHTRKESLDTAYLMELLEALLVLKVSDLPQTRQPGEDDVDDWQSGVKSFKAWDPWGDDDQEPRRAAKMYELVRDNPDEVADFLEEHGINARDIEQLILNRSGLVRRRKG